MKVALEEIIANVVSYAYETDEEHQVVVHSTH